MSKTQEIKDYVRSLGMDFVGVAGVDRFSDAPEGKRPGDILPGAKSVVVFGVRLLDGAMQSIFRTYEEGRKNVHGLYATYGMQITPNMHMGHAALSLAAYLENELGALAVPTTSGPFQTASAFSQRRAAVAAGLGQYGWHGHVLTKEYGPRVRWGSVITNLELEADPLDLGPALCDPTKCQVCVNMCPTGAIAPYSDENRTGVTVSGVEQVTGKINMNRCKAACYGMVDIVTSTYDAKKQDHEDGYTANFDHSSKYGKAQSSSKLIDLSGEVTDEDMKAAFEKFPPSLSGLQAYPNWKCSLCQAYCPVGDWKRRFADRGLSSHSGAESEASK